MSCLHFTDGAIEIIQGGDLLLYPYCDTTIKQMAKRFWTKYLVSCYGSFRNMVVDTYLLVQIFLHWI